MATPNAPRPAGKGRLLVTAAALAVVAGVGIAALLVSVFEHKQEAKTPFFQVVDLNDTIDDPAIWGQNFPLQYDRYKKTTDMERTRYGGSEGVPHSPTEADPRSIVARSKLELDPRLKTMWAGYAFAADYREKRGHAYMLEDQAYTERQRVAKQPGACLNCHASLYPTYLRLGEGDLTKGFEAINHMSYADARKQVTHPISCVDCHEAKTMNLRISRPAFVEGIRALKASQGVNDYDVNRDATRQEMRSYVCAQCHVTYYFRGAEKRLTFPWPKGLKVDQIVAAENEDKVGEWTHKDTGASMMKARHPEFETWSQGIHARSGVACADCHMPYVREGAMKISDHNVRSPLLNVNASCQTCHRWPEQELKDRVEEIQTRFVETRNVAMNALVELIGDIKQAKDAGATDEELAAARKHQRDGQFKIDFLVSENSMGFHADQYTVKSFAEAINLCREGQLVLRHDVKARNIDFAPTPASIPAVAH
ncbi:ammonia-forming cytochrome c nitrite reductase subunit c552 [Telmatospirillum sp.]|uniref:ammonia-forming cytochrome c nitrite reductase subunit c552 n=1 Tax=Telmatospirillum sp. TaxID=2079197 RepID=UPI002849CD04|nr:ammonia-forming cytochrome c nitrite reductase subunit c552 [Telmatospirillum sp.]MDR3439398.1 ammonia-forming cytochrome c nitrite reductase subunit c552 [Telmatospirillum sp.]